MPVTPASRPLRVLAILLAAAWSPACSDGSSGNGDADGDGPRDAADAEDGAEAVFPDEHPRIYLNEAHRARLEGLLAGARPAATRFRTMVDNQLGGADYYAFRASDAALLWQLTGEAAYADYAVGMVEDFVASEEALIAGGERPEVAFDSYLYVGEEVGEVALVYD